MLILYGSETGTAQDVAEGIWRQSKRLGFTSTVLAMDEYDISKLIYEPLVIFVCSTTGQGDPPENMTKFWRFLLRKNLPLDSLSHSRVAVLGLGDSSYSKFNYTAKKLARRLAALGAFSVLETGLCDDQHDLGLHAVVAPWTEKLWNCLERFYPHLNNPKPHAHEDSLLIRWRVVPIDTSPTIIEFPPGEPSQRIWTTVCDNIRVTPKQHFQEVRLITLRPVCSQVEYAPGAVAYLRPSNAPEAVAELISLLGDRMAKVFKLEPVHMPIPSVLEGQILSFEDLATVFWDLNSVPRRYVFEVLSKVTNSDLEREKLEEFLIPEGLEELYSYCNRQKRTTLEVLSDFPSATANLQLDHLFEIFQPIRPRAYSIASSIEFDGSVVKILVAIVKYKTRLSTLREGLASKWLSRLTGTVCIAIKPPTLRFPQECPVVMVGPGTGVAPFRSFISKKISEAYTVKGDRLIHQMILIFGCRYQNADFHFKNELENWKSSDEIILITAFSRDQPEKIYVQDKILSESRVIFENIFNNGGVIFVAGSSKDMPVAVKNAFIKILSSEGSLTMKEAEQYIENMEIAGRYQEETWS